jgi:glutamate synthase (NADPH/NADH) small chain
MPTGEQFELEADLVITAIGTVPEAWLAGDRRLASSAGETIGVDELRRTARPRTLAGGDVTRGPATVVLAIADGMRAARTIDEELRMIAPDVQPSARGAGPDGPVSGARSGLS